MSEDYDLTLYINSSHLTMLEMAYSYADISCFQDQPRPLTSSDVLSRVVTHLEAKHFALGNSSHHASMSSREVDHMIFYFHESYVDPSYC